MPLTVDLAVVVLAGTLLVLGFLSRVSKRVTLSPVLLALVLGIVLGPHVTGLVDLTEVVPRHTLLDQTARLALGLAVADIGLRTRLHDVRDNARRLAVLLAVGMPGMFLMTALGAWLILDLPFPVALVLGAVLTPTDPAAASTLVSGELPERYLPHRLRRTLQVESGSNDGLALPFVLLAGFVVAQPPGAALAQWIARTAFEIGLAVGIGVALGLLSGVLTRYADRVAAVGESYLPLVGGMTGLVALALTHLAGGTGILASFVAAVALSALLPGDLRRPMCDVQEALTKLGIISAFLVFGLVLPLPAMWSLGVAGVGFAAWVLLLRRPPVVGPALLPTRTGPLTSAFLGWFGPLGLAAVYYLAYVERFGLAEYERILAGGSVAIVASIAVHTVTALPAVKGYGDRTGAARPEGETAGLPGRLP